MRAAIFNPYLDTLGGGERYTFAVAKTLANRNYAVDVEWKDSSIKETLEKRFGINLDDINFISDAKRGDGYDVCFWVSDGSIPTLKARKNLLHFQVPFHDVSGKTLLNRMKLFRINKIICNSNFTKKFIDEEYGVDSVVVYPPVPVEKLKPKRKENLIISVGRFSNLEQSKRQDVLIDAFKRFYDSGGRDWKFILAGGIEIGADAYIKKLEKMREGYPIKIIKSPNFEELKDIYGKAKIFWTASGYGIKEDREPEKVEHFGITVVEAMAAGAVPIVYNAGGHKEIIEDGINGFLWHNTHELIKKTKQITDNKIKLAKNAISASKRFSYDEFRKNITKIL